MSASSLHRESTDSLIKAESSVVIFICVLLDCRVPSGTKQTLAVIGDIVAKRLSNCIRAEKAVKLVQFCLEHFLIVLGYRYI